MSPSKPLSERSPNKQATSPSKTLSQSQSHSLEKKLTDMKSPPSNNILSNDLKPIPRFEVTTNTSLGHSHGPNGNNNTYISPSDAIRSPTTKKLSEIKGKRFQNAKPQTLFAKTLALQGLKAQSENLKRES
ncbi:hypothetical protein LTR84_000480 [Exophiala bonariae]|uniref:Uncharacterized protein n=1 Tax=Exophiala bonariae TaxID=1690606 RepID=A0AAV9NRB5_9EURO|nr:hypothetical protein LTR84_000480 [Exophiala bonariae]